MVDKVSLELDVKESRGFTFLVAADPMYCGFRLKKVPNGIYLFLGKLKMKIADLDKWCYENADCNWIAWKSPGHRNPELMDKFMEFIDDNSKTDESLVSSLQEALKVAANQLEGVSLGIKKHGQNINVQFWINTYDSFAKEARRLLNKEQV